MKEPNVEIIWPNNKISSAFEGDDWFLIAEQIGFKISRGCLTGSCGACEIDVNGDTIRPCITNIKAQKKCPLKVTLTSDPFW